MATVLASEGDYRSFLGAIRLLDDNRVDGALSTADGRLKAQLLARLRHPNVAQVYDAGTHDDGSGAVPYFVMEYVPNPRTLVEYAETKELGTLTRANVVAAISNTEVQPAVGTDD